MPIEIEDPKEQEEKRAAAAEERRKKVAAAAGAPEEDEAVGQKRELWPLIPAIPVVLAIALSLIPEKPEVDEQDLIRGKCASQLMRVQYAKVALVEKRELAEGDALSEEDIAELRKLFTCPGGGELNVGEAGYEPSCRLHGPVSTWVTEQQNVAYWEKVLKEQ